jgi:hypothetical protein
VSHQGDADITLITLAGLHSQWRSECPIGELGCPCRDLDPTAPTQPRCAADDDGNQLICGTDAGDEVCVVAQGDDRRRFPMAMVHQAGVLALANVAADFQGGFGLAQRPCDVASNNAPSSTLDCTRPLVYASMRWQPQVRTVTAIRHGLDICSDPEAFASLDADLKSGYCDAQIEPVRGLSVGELSTANVQLGVGRPILADVGFSRSGNELYVVQSNPGGLLRVDTSIGADGDTRDVPAGQVEVCAQPTSFAIYDDGGSQFGLVTCYRSGEVFIVDLASFTVVGLSRTGIGPDALAVDLAREVVYVANTLDATITVIDMSRARSTRFNQIARIGLQEPYEQ